MGFDEGHIVWEGYGFNHMSSSKICRSLAPIPHYPQSQAPEFGSLEFFLGRPERRPRLYSCCFPHMGLFSPQTLIEREWLTDIGSSERDEVKIEYLHQVHEQIFRIIHPAVDTIVANTI